MQLWASELELELLLPLWLLMLLLPWPLSSPGFGSSFVFPALEVSWFIIAGPPLLLLWRALALMLEGLQSRWVLVRVSWFIWPTAEVSCPFLVVLVVSCSKAVCSESLTVVVVLIVFSCASAALVVAIRRPGAVLGGRVETSAVAKVHFCFPSTTRKCS